MGRVCALGATGEKGSIYEIGRTRSENSISKGINGGAYIYADCLAERSGNRLH